MNQNDASSSSSSPILKKQSYKKRRKTLKKKAEELSILCGVPVGLICVEPDGKVETWPEEREAVEEIIRQYLSKTTNATSFQIENRNPKSGGGEGKNKGKLMYETWYEDLDYLPEESLMEIVEYIEEQEKILDERILREKNKNNIKRGLGFQIHEI